MNYGFKEQKPRALAGLSLSERLTRGAAVTHAPAVPIVVAWWSAASRARGVLRYTPASSSLGEACPGLSVSSLFPDIEITPEHTAVATGQTAEVAIAVCPGCGTEVC
jgi:hypothetical protein